MKIKVVKTIGVEDFEPWIEIRISGFVAASKNLRKSSQVYSKLCKFGKV